MRRIIQRINRIPWWVLVLALVAVVACFVGIIQMDREWKRGYEKQSREIDATQRLIDRAQR